LPKIISPSVKSQIIKLHLEGKGRNAISETPGVKEYASAGTVSSVIMKYQQSEKQPKSATSSEKTSTEVVKKNPDISIEDHLITNTQDFEKNGHAENSLEIGRKGAPLSWFTTGTDLVQTPQPQPRSEQVQSNNEEDSHPKSGINNPGSHVAGGLVSQRPDHGQIAEETHSQSQSLIETETPNTVPSESVKLKTLPEETFMEIQTDQE